MTKEQVEALRATNPALAQQVLDLMAQNEKLTKASLPSDRTPIGEKLTIKVSEKGAVSVYGLNVKFPITLYYSQWIRLLAVADQVRSFIEANKSKLKMKE